MLRTMTALALITLAVGWPQAPSADEPAKVVPVATDLPAGTYQLDPAHASLTFRVNHLGMSNYTARFADFHAELQLDPADPAASKVTATIDPASFDPSNPPEGFKATLLGTEFFDVIPFPEITFHSTEVELTGSNSARITGELGLHGVTMPVVMEAVFNGGYAGHPMDPAGSRIGFSAHGALKRSGFGMGFGVPAPGTTLGVGDDVAFEIEAEFTRPTAPTDAAAKAAAQ